MKQILFIIITLIVIFYLYYNTNNKERMSSLFKKLPTKLTYEYDKELTSSEILALTYMGYASGPEFKKGINNYLTEDVTFIGTGREAKGKEYIIERLEKRRKEVLYRVAHIILVQEVGNKVFIVREDPPNSSLYTMYLFIIDNNSNKIKSYFKLVDYLKKSKNDSSSFEIVREILYN
jgi:hypothetical protein